jgi:hypothetical protein
MDPILEGCAHQWSVVARKDDVRSLSSRAAYQINTGASGMRKFSSILVATPLAVLVAPFAVAPPAHATGSLTRSFVSSAGIDSNPCTITQPCATFAAAYAAVAVNGIVAALDPGKYGPLTNITTGVTINGNGWSAITALANSNGITINAGTANVTLIGIEIDGAEAGYNGILVNSAGSLTVTDCTLQNFINNGVTDTGNGIFMGPGSGTFNFTITNTTVSNNANSGIYYFPSGSPNTNGVIDNAVANANQTGITINMDAAGGGTTVVTVSNSTASENTDIGIAVDGGSGSTVKVSIDNVSASSNSQGVFATGTANVLLGRSVITGNSTGVLNSTSPNTFYTYSDNRINLNGVGADISGNAPNTFSRQ